MQSQAAAGKVALYEVANIRDCCPPVDRPGWLFAAVAEAVGLSPLAADPAVGAALALALAELPADHYADRAAFTRELIAELAHLASRADLAMAASLAAELGRASGGEELARHFGPRPPRKAA